MQFKDPRILWKTDVGSWMWKMNRPDSDHDYYVSYIFDSRSFLLGNLHDHGHQTRNETGDESKLEVGAVVKQLLKGNVNHLWGILSPLVEITSEEHDVLRSIVKRNPATNCYNSIMGLAMHNLRDYFDSPTSKQKAQNLMQENEALYRKKLNIIARSLAFGISIFEGKGYLFTPTNYTQRSEIDELLREFENAYASSSLPKKPDVSAFEKFLFECRMKNLKENLPI